MKKILGTLALTLMLTLSCSKEFINIDPVATVTTDLVYKTDKDFQDALTNVYSVFQTVYSDMWQFGDLRGDDMKSGLVSNLGASEMDKFILNQDAGILSNAWRNYYIIINRSNNILTKIANADAAVVINKDRYIGETKFLRALAYFNLVRIFGDVPMVTTVLSIDESYKVGREKVSTIYDNLIIPDLLDAESKLPVKYTGTDVGRATQGAAKSILGKVYMTVHDFVKAEAKLAEVTTMGYALLPKFTDLFDYSKNEHHTEYIFDIEYEEGINEGSTFTTQFSISFQGSGALCNVLIAAYNLPTSTVGSGGDQGCPTDNLFNAYDPADLRKGISVAKGYTYNGVFTPISPTGIGSFTLKYMVSSVKLNDSKANWKVIRYADVLLMYAEALNENGKTAAALPYLNQVHTRAGLPAYSALSQSDTRNNIYLERRLELFAEGHRWFDLLRTGLAYSTMQSAGMKTYNVLFPVPQAQIDVVKNVDIFWQNDGY
jgi:starch-binding outer membrane protein, SusD/RagB family